MIHESRQEFQRFFIGLYTAKSSFAALLATSIRSTLARGTRITHEEVPMSSLGQRSLHRLHLLDFFAERSQVERGCSYDESVSHELITIAVVLMH